MKTYRHIRELQAVDNAVVTIGTFDGVHIGHQKILKRVKELAGEIGGEAVILTFFPHPRMILNPEDQSLKMLTTISEKSELLAGLGIDHLVITPFTRDFSNLSPEQYIREILVEKIGIRRIVIGYDHRFGKDRSGGIKDLQLLAPKFGYAVEEIPEQDIHDVAVSSTRIRKALETGDVASANAFLGYNFHIHGKVIKGDQLGRQLGYPTANLFVEEPYKLIPADGIYAVTIELDKGGSQPASSHPSVFKGMGYIGNRPTLNGMQRNIEINIFDFSGDLYGSMIKVNFHHFIRGDQRFAGLEELKVKLGEDKENAMTLLENKF